MLRQLVDSGFALIEVPLGEKGPMSTGWNLAHNAITSVDDTAKLQGKNVGIAHAYCSPAPTCAIDIDNYRFARNWLANEGFDLKAELLRADSVVFGSGKRYSIKILFRMPASFGPQITRQIMSRANEVVLEFRCATRKGTTVQDLIPPSVHPSGKRYKWLGNGNILRLPTIPDDLLAIWQRLNQADQAHMKCLSRNVRAASPRDLALVADALQFISADCGYIVWRNVVWALLSTGWQNAEEIARVWSETAPSRFDLEKFYLLVNSYDPTSKPKHTLGTVYHYARKGGWNG